MPRTTWLVLTGLLAIPLRAEVAEPLAVHPPASVAAIQGCWKGRGEVMAKPVTLSLAAEPILEGTMLAVDAESSAVADDSDRYSAHLIFGGGESRQGEPNEVVTGFWADSFGGAYTATGRGESQTDGFEIVYHYPEADFVNRWRLSRDRLEWQIVARSGDGAEKPFAAYTLARAACPSTVPSR